MKIWIRFACNLCDNYETGRRLRFRRLPDSFGTRCRWIVDRVADDPRWWWRWKELAFWLSPAPANHRARRSASRWWQETALDEKIKFKFRKICTNSITGRVDLNFVDDPALKFGELEHVLFATANEQTGVLVRVFLDAISQFRYVDDSLIFAL